MDPTKNGDSRAEETVDDSSATSTDSSSNSSEDDFDFAQPGPSTSHNDNSDINDIDIMDSEELYGDLPDLSVDESTITQVLTTIENEFEQQEFLVMAGQSQDSELKELYTKIAEFIGTHLGQMDEISAKLQEIKAQLHILDSDSDDEPEPPEI